MQTASSPKKASSAPKSMAKLGATSANRTQNAARDLIEVLVLVVVIFLGIKLSFESRPISGSSMEPGLHTDQYALINKLDYIFGSPQRGDVIIFHYPQNPSDIFIKRIIGLPGDTVVITPTTVAVNGVTLNEPYISKADNCAVMIQAELETATQCQTMTMTKTLGPNEFWVLGDNRLVSDDSRIWGPLNRSFIIGKASFVWWPLSALHGIDGHHSVFTKVPDRGMAQTGDPVALLFFAPLGMAALRVRRVLASER